MKQIIAFSFILIIPVGFAQEKIISIDSCIQWSKRNYPLIKQKEAFLKQESINRSAINENWIPKLSFMAQATYNTEVVQFNIPGMNLKFPHDAYMTALNLEQTLYDGGQSKKGKIVESMNQQINTQQNEIDLYKLVDQVNQLYVNVLLGKENLKILQLLKEDLRNRMEVMQISVSNGLVLQSSLDELEAESLKTDQNIIETNQNLEALFQNLSFYTNHTIAPETTFEMTSIGGNSAIIEIQRPELKIFDLQEKLIEAKYNQTNVQAIPKITLNAAGNYGRPGPNFINQNMRFFGSANITLRWSINSLYGLKREQKRMDLNKSLVEIQKETFLFAVQTAMNSQLAQLTAISKQIETDELIIQKRELVTKVAQSQMDNGKITVTNYLTQLNAELQSKLNKKVHEIKRMNAVSIINATSGSLNF